MKYQTVHIKVLFNYRINVIVHCKLYLVSLSWSSSPNHISHSGIPSFCPIVFSIWSVLSTSQGHHRIGGAECFVDGDFWADLSACHYSNPFCHLLLLLCRWGQCGPHVHFSPICLGKTIAWGSLLFGVALLIFWVLVLGELANPPWLQISSWRLTLC